MKKYKLVVAGGTFDHFHKGHEAFLDYILSLSDKVLLGITSDEFAKRKLPDKIEPFSVRKQAVRDYLTSQNAADRVTISEIDSVHIPIEFQKLPIEAIIVTEDTKIGAGAVNSKRAKLHLPLLAVEVMPLTEALDHKPISSRRIRSGELQRDGTVYFPESLLQQSFILPEELRETLKKPFGTLIINNDFAYHSLSMQKVVTVGDIATKTFLERQLTPHIAIVDLVVERKKTYNEYQEIGFVGKELLLTAENPPGQITASLFVAIKTAFSYHPLKHVVIAVTGEEDLAVIPVLLAAPIGMHVFYGQPGEGLVHVEVTEEKKTFALGLLQQFRTV